MNHAILTRIRFNQDEAELRDKYIKICKKILVPALNAQVCQDFTWVIMCHPWDEEYLAEELDYPFRPVSYQSEFNKASVWYKWRIQTRHDCDDYADPRYMHLIQEAAAELLDRYPAADRFLIQSQPKKWDLRTNKLTTLDKYTRTRNSMHLTLVQRGEISTNIHARQHSEMHKELGRSGKVLTLPGNPTFWVIHGDNITLNRNRK